MANQIEWYGQDKRVVLHTYEGKTTGQIFLDMATQSAELLKTVDYPVQLIINRIDANFTEFKPTKMTAINNLVPENQDLVIVIGAGFNVETLSKVVGNRVAPKAFTTNTYYVSSMAEAHEVLKRERGIEL